MLASRRLTLVRRVHALQEEGRGCTLQCDSPANTSATVRHGSSARWAACQVWLFALRQQPSTPPLVVQFPNSTNTSFPTGHLNLSLTSLALLGGGTPQLRFPPTQLLLRSAVERSLLQTTSSNLHLCSMRQSRCFQLFDARGAGRQLVDGSGQRGEGDSTKLCGGCKVRHCHARPRLCSDGA